jgi:hypothetical protein
MKRAILALVAVLVIAVGIGGAGAAVPTGAKLTKRTVVRVVQAGQGQVAVACKAGERTTGGGFSAGLVGNENVRITGSEPLQGLSGWIVEFVNDSGSSTDMAVFAICTT